MIEIEHEIEVMHRRIVASTPGVDSDWIKDIISNIHQIIKENASGVLLRRDLLNPLVDFKAYVSDVLKRDLLAFMCKRFDVRYAIFKVMDDQIQHLRGAYPEAYGAAFRAILNMELDSSMAQVLNGHAFESCDHNTDFVVSKFSFDTYSKPFDDLFIQDEAELMDDQDFSLGGINPDVLVQVIASHLLACFVHNNTMKVLNLLEDLKVPKFVHRIGIDQKSLFDILANNSDWLKDIDGSEFVSMYPLIANRLIELDLYDNSSTIPLSSAGDALKPFSNELSSL